MRRKVERAQTGLRADGPACGGPRIAGGRANVGTWHTARRLTVTISWLVGATISPSSAGAAVLYLNAAGGTRNWDQLTTPAWSLATGGPYNVTWNAGLGTDAVFEGIGGVVNIQAAAPVSVTSLTFGTSGAQAYTLSGAALNLAATASITATTNATITSAITGAGTSLVKRGAGTLTFSGAKAYTGATLVEAGRLVLENASGFVSATTVNAGATLAFTGTTNVTMAAPITLANGAALENLNTSGFTVLNGALTSSGSTSITIDQPAGAGGRGLFLDAGLHGSGTVTINTTNAGNLVSLRNNNSTFSGTLVINGIASAAAGAGSGLALGGPATSNALINANVVVNGTIELADQGMGWANGFGTSRFNMGALSGTGIIVGNRNPTGNFGSTIVLGNTNDSGLFSGRIVRGSGRTNVIGVTKVGTGTQIFSGANGYTGATNVNVGVLNIRHNTALGTTAGGTTVASGAALQIEGDIAVGAEALTLNGFGIANDGALRNMSGANAYGGAITLGSAARINADAGMLTLGTITGAGQNLTLGGAGDTTITGPIGTTTGTLTKDGSGTAILSGTNTYSGGTAINGGAVQISSDANLGNAAGGLAFDGGTLRTSAGLTTHRATTLNAGGGTIDTNGFDVSMGGVIGGAGALTKTGAGALILTGNNAYSGATTVSAGTLQVGDGGTSGTLGTGAIANNASLVFNRSDALGVGGVITGAGTIRQIGSGLTTLTGNSGAFTGTTSVEAGSLAVNGRLCGAMNVQTGGRLQGTGTVCDTTNFTGGTVAPGNSIGTLTIAGNYTGNGGLLEMEGVLAGTGSPADRLLITGNATGNTTVEVINLGGTGASTGVGNTDGISIIQVGGTSTASTFQLQGGYAAAGPYQYHLNFFAPGTSSAGQADPLLGTLVFGDYRLQSAMDASGASIPVPQIGGYQAMPSGALRYGASLLNGLHKRLGEIRHLRSTSGGIEEGLSHKEFFLREQTSRTDFSGDRGPSFDQDIEFVQVGGNFVKWDIGETGSTLRLGGALSFGASNLSVKGSSAKVDLKGSTLAFMTTYQGARGEYLDVIAQGTQYRANVKTSERGNIGNPKGWGLVLSVEGGYPFEVGEKLILEPQVQLAYQRVRFDRFTDVDNIRVDLENGNSLSGRAGLRVQKTYEARGQQWSPFVEINLLHEFLKGGTIQASGVGFRSDLGGTGLQVGAGLNAQLGRDTALFLTLGYEKGISKESHDTWSGTLGVRMNF